MIQVIEKLKQAAFVWLGRRIDPNTRAILLLDPAYVQPAIWDDPLNQKPFDEEDSGRYGILAMHNNLKKSF